jgi:hypothetical protein
VASWGDYFLFPQGLPPVDALAGRVPLLGRPPVSAQRACNDWGDRAVDGWQQRRPQAIGVVTHCSAAPMLLLMLMLHERGGRAVAHGRLTEKLT